MKPAPGGTTPHRFSYFDVLICGAPCINSFSKRMIIYLPYANQDPR
jgi:hypothetical protein